jgi:cobalamin biosynthesis protein CbiD
MLPDGWNGVRVISTFRIRKGYSVWVLSGNRGMGAHADDGLGVAPYNAPDLAQRIRALALKA